MGGQDSAIYPPQGVVQVQKQLYHANIADI